MLKTYSEMMRYATFEERYAYLRIGGAIGEATFGSSRYLNQRFYTSSLWRSTRRGIIIRDGGCDLADREREIFGTILIHHLNPVTVDDLLDLSDLALDPEFLVCVTTGTHGAIHFGDASMLPPLPTERSRHDTSPWLLGADSRRNQ
jgi:hypothetical protein